MSYRDCILVGVFLDIYFVKVAAERRWSEIFSSTGFSGLSSSLHDITISCNKLQEEFSISAGTHERYTMEFSFKGVLKETGDVIIEVQSFGPRPAERPQAAISNNLPANFLITPLPLLRLRIGYVCCGCLAYAIDVPVATTVCAMST